MSDTNMDHLFVYLSNKKFLCLHCPIIEPKYVYNKLGKSSFSCSHSIVYRVLTNITNIMR